MDTNKILLIIILIIIFCLGIKLTQPNQENFTNNNTNNNSDNNNSNVKKLSGVPPTNDLNNIVSHYNKYNETYISSDDGIDYSVLYKNYLGDLKNKKTWNNMTLSQCRDACNKLDGCVGFSRDNIDDDQEGNCYPRSHISICHSIRKGSPIQRENASKYNTFIKLNVGNQKNKCLGTNNLTLNRNIIIKSFAKPDFYVSNHENNIKLKKYDFKGSQFIKNCKFKIVPGLSGEGTVSFEMIDDFNEKYYLCDNGLGSITIVPISMDDAKRTDLLTRNRASFELLDGYANRHQVTFRTFSLTNNHKYLILKNSDSDEPRLALVDAKEALKKPKDVTFDIIDDIKHKSVLQIDREYNTAHTKPHISKSTTGFSSQQFRGRRISSNDVKSDKFKNTKEKFNSDKQLISPVSIRNKLEIYLEGGIMIPINSNIPDIRVLHPSYINPGANATPSEINASLNAISIKIKRVIVNDPIYQFGIYRYKDYQGGNTSDGWNNRYPSGTTFPNNYIDFLGVSSSVPNTKPNLILEAGDVINMDTTFDQKLYNSSNSRSRNLTSHEKNLDRDPHNMIVENTSTPSHLNFLSIKLYRNYEKNIYKGKDSKYDNQYQYLLNIEREIEGDNSNRNYSNTGINTYIQNSKNKLNKLKNKIKVNNSGLLEQYQKNEELLNNLKSKRNDLEIREYANEYYFLKNRSEDVTKNLNL